MGLVRLTERHAKRIAGVLSCWDRTLDSYGFNRKQKYLNNSSCK